MFENTRQFLKFLLVNVVKPLVSAWGKLIENVEDAQCLLKCVESNKLCYQEMSS